MTYQKLLILGGTGNVGFSIAQQLLKETNLSLIISSRNAEKAHFTAGELNAHSTDEWSYRVTGIQLEPNNQAELKSILNQVDAVIITASGIDTAKLAEALIETHKDCIDIRENSDKQRILQHYHAQFIENNVFYLSESGSFPGLPTLLIRYLLKQMPNADHAIANVLIRMDWKKYPFSQTTIKEFTENLQYFQSKVWYKNHWKSVNNWRDVAKIKFDNNLAKTCVPMVLPETTALVEQYPHLQYLNARIAGFNPVVDYLIMPLLQWTTFPLSSALEWGLKRFSKPPFGTYFQAEVSHSNDRHRSLKISVNHAEGYELTAISTTAAMLQCLKTEQKTAGLHLQGLWAEPLDFIEQLKRMGAKVQI